MDITKRAVKMKTGKRDMIMIKASNNNYYYYCYYKLIAYSLDRFILWNMFSGICFGLIKSMVILMD